MRTLRMDDGISNANVDVSTLDDIFISDQKLVT